MSTEPREPKEHALKTATEFFRPMSRGDKTFEIRENDRDFRVGDTLRLEEYDAARRERNPLDTGMTGRFERKRITYMTDFAQQPRFVVLALGEAR